MASLLLSVFFSCIALLLVVLLFLLFAPIIFSTEFTISTEEPFAVFQLSWLNPSFLKFRYETKDKQLTFAFLWIKRIMSSGGKPSETGAPERVVQSADRIEKSGRKTDPESLQNTGPASYESTVPPPLNSAWKKTRQNPADSDGFESPEAAEPIRKKRNPNSPTGTLTLWEKIRTAWKISNTLNWRRRIVAWTGRVLPAFFNIVRFDRLRLHVSAGTADPAETGRWFGYFIAGKAAILQEQKNVSITFEPRFLQDCFASNGSFILRTSPAMLLWPVFFGLVTFPYLSTFLVWRRWKKVHKAEK